MTYEQMCEVISWAIEDSTGERYGPRRIFEMSPTGELWPVHDIYERSLAYIERRFGP